MTNMVLKKKDRLVFVMLTTYFFIAVYGNVFKFSAEEGSFGGLSTFLILGIIVSKLHVMHKALLRNTLFLTILYVFLWCIISSLFSGQGVLVAYRSLILLFGYLLAAMSVYQMQLTEQRIRLLFYTLGVSIFIASALTIIDYLKIYNVPYVNETNLGTRIGGGKVEQAGGFFPRRSAMAAFYSMIIASLMYYSFKVKNVKAKVFMLGSSGVSFIALVLTHNRSGVLSIVMALFLYLLIDNSIKVGKKLSVLVYMAIIFGAIGYAIYIYFPGTLDVYIMKLNSYLPGAGIEAAQRTSEIVTESDQARADLFVSVMKSLLSNPIGNGFTLVYTEKRGYMNPHNIITYVIWAAGVMAFIWIPLFVRQVYKYFSLKKLRKKSDVNETMIICLAGLQVGLLSWFLNNMAHNSLSTGLAWLFFGLSLNIKRQLDEDDQVYPVRKESEIMENKRKYPHLMR